MGLERRVECPCLLERSASQPVVFTSPLFRHHEGELRNYSRVASKRTCHGRNSPPILPASDTSRIPRTQILDRDASIRRQERASILSTQLYTTGRSGGEGCVWQEGGPFLPGTTNTVWRQSDDRLRSTAGIGISGCGRSANLPLSQFSESAEQQPLPPG